MIPPPAYSSFRFVPRGVPLRTFPIFRLPTATLFAGTGHQASAFREGIVTALIAGGSLAITVAVALILWGLCVSKS